MTTTVTVQASSHDVTVQAVKPEHGTPIGPAQTVLKGDKYVFYAHSGQDLVIAEIKDVKPLG